MVGIIDFTQLMDLDYAPDFQVESPKVDLPDQSAIAIPTKGILKLFRSIVGVMTGFL